MPVSKPPLAAALRVGGQVVLGFHIHAYNGLTFGAAELIYGPPSACVHLGVRLPLLDLVHAVCKTVFGDAPPALTALDVGLVMALDNDQLNGEHANGREAVTTFGHRDKLISAPFSPKLGAVEVKCGGAEEWRRKAELYWYPLSQLRPWFEEALTAGQSDDRVAEHFRSMSHNAQHAQNRLQTQKYKDKPSIGLQRKGLTRPAWQAWALMGYRLEPDGGATDRAGHFTSEQGLARVAEQERLPSPGPLQERPSLEVMRCLLAPMDAQTTGAMVRKNAAAGGQAAKGSRTMHPRPGDVLWLLSATGPRVVLVLGHARWGGGSDKSGLLLKALPTTGDDEFAPLSGLAQLQPDLLQPVNHVIMFNKLLDVEWICPAPDGPGATAAPPTADANAELRGALKDAIRAYLSGEAEQDQLGMGAWLADGISIKPEEYETGGEWTHLRSLAGIDVLLSRRYAVWRGEMLHFPGEVVSAILKEEPLPWEAEAGGPGHEGELEEGEVGSPILDRRAEARADRLRDKEVAAFEAEARREQAAAGERGVAEAAGRIPAGVVLHGASAAGASSSSATGSTLPTAPLGGGSNPPGPGSKRKLETGSGEEPEPEAARLCRARLRAREVGEAPAVSVSSTYRAAVLEGFRRVLSGARTRPDPEAYWAAKVPGRPFPFSGELARLKAEMSAASLE